MMREIYYCIIICKRSFSKDTSFCSIPNMLLHNTISLNCSISAHLLVEKD